MVYTCVYQLEYGSGDGIFWSPKQTSTHLMFSLEETERNIPVAMLAVEGLKTGLFRPRSVRKGWVCLVKITENNKEYESSWRMLEPGIWVGPKINEKTLDKP